MAAAVRALGRLPRHAGALLAGGGAGATSSTSRCARRRRRPTRSTTSWPSGWRPDAYRPAGAVRAVPHRGAGHHRRPVRRPGRPRRARGRPDLVGAGDPDLPPGPLPRAGASPAGRTRWRSWARPRTSTPATTRATCAALEERRRYFVAHGAVSADHSHVDVRTDPLEPARGGAHLPGGAGRPTPSRRGGRGVPPAHAARDGPDVVRRRAGDDPAPGRAPQTTTARPPRGSGRTPATTSRSRSSSPTRCARCWSATAPIPGSTWSCSRSTRPCSPASSPRWPGSTPSLYVGAPWWFLDAPHAIRRFRRGGHRDRRLLPHVRVHRRHPRVLLDPGPARHVPPRRRRLARPARGRAPARRGRGARDRASTWSPASRGRCSSCERHPAGRPALSRSAGTAGPRAGAARAPRAGQLLPRPPGLVHRPRPRRRGLGHRRLHRPQRARWPTP